MHPFFFAVGPAFSKECKVPPFENVNLFPLFCEVLKINCPEVNGTLQEFKKCLSNYQYESSLYKSICEYIILSIIIELI